MPLNGLIFPRRLLGLLREVQNKLTHSISKKINKVRFKMPEKTKYNKLNKIYILKIS